MSGWITAILSGALMSIQGVFNTGVSKQTQIWISSGFVQLTAFLVCVFAWMATGREGNIASLFHIENKYMLSGGVLGALITFTVIRSMDDLGPCKAALLIVVSQLAVAYLVELLGIFGVERVSFEWRKLIGMAIAIAGIIVFKWE